MKPLGEYGRSPGAAGDREISPGHTQVTHAEPLHEPQCNIVAFRYLPVALRTAPAAQVDALQLQLRRAVIESGEFYLVQSRIDGRPVLRTTMMNPLTNEEDLRELLECLRRFGGKIASTDY